MPNFGETTIAEYEATEKQLVLRFSERSRTEYYTMRDKTRGKISVLIVQAEVLENDGFGHYLPVRVFSYAEKHNELCGTVPADCVRERVYERLMRDVMKKEEF